MGVPGSMPSSVSCCCCCFLEQGTLLSLLQSAQLYKWVNLSHQYCEEFGDLSPEGAVQVWRDLPGEGFTVKINDREKIFRVFTLQISIHKNCFCSYFIKTVKVFPTVSVNPIKNIDYRNFLPEILLFTIFRDVQSDWLLEMLYVYWLGFANWYLYR